MTLDGLHQVIDILEMEIEAGPVDAAHPAYLADRDFRQFFFAEKLRKGIDNSAFRQSETLVVGLIH